MLRFGRNHHLSLPILLLISLLLGAAAVSCSQPQPANRDARAATSLPHPPMPPGAEETLWRGRARARLLNGGSIPLAAGWNLVSLSELPADTDPAAVLASISGSYERVLAYDNCDAADPWKEYDPADIPSSDLTTIDNRIGFWVEATTGAALNDSGTPQTGVAIPLCQGWNLIGYPLSQAYPTAAVLAPIAGQYTLLYAHEVTDSADPWAVHSPNIQPWAEPLADLALMEPGRGYWLYATENTTLIVDVPAPTPTPTATPTATPTPGPTPLPDPGDTTPPLVAIDAPTEDVELFAPTDVVGSVSDPNLTQWTLAYAPAGGDFAVFKTGYSDLTGDILGQLDTTLLPNGFGRIRLTATDSNDNTATVERNVLLSGENKPGIFTLTYTDLDINLAGFPIRIDRVYDSRLRRQSADFGHGWSLQVVERATYRNNRPPGDGWTFGSASPFGCNNAQQTRSHYTEIRFSDVEFYRFAVTVTPGGYFSGGCTGQVGFTQVGGVPGAALTVNGNDVVYWQDGSEELLDFNTFALYNPAAVRLTTADGRVYDVHRQRGVTAIGDVYGNTLTINQGSVQHSSGVAVDFYRDGQGRITGVEDPAGNVITYAYDGAGDLVTVTDRAGNATTFAYDDHLLTEISDPLGRLPLRNEYDDAGRLVAQYDGDGNAVEIAVDTANNLSAVRGASGGETRYEYDDRGHVTAVERGAARYEFTYDADGNRTTATDPLGHTRTFSYSADGVPVSESTARGGVYAYGYADGRLSQMSDPAGGLSALTYDANGEPLRIQGADGITAQALAYDAAGNLVSAETLGTTLWFTYDALGNQTTVTKTNGLEIGNAYDANSRLVGRTVTHTVDGATQPTTTTYAYDANDRVTQISHSDGYTTTLEYNANGRVVRRVDERNAATAYQYDARGLLTRRTDCDGGYEAFGYDENGNLTAHTDRAGRTTFYAYNAFGQLLYTIFPDGAARFYTVDAAGRLVRETDERGHDTVYTLDADGNRTAITSPLGHTTVLTYTTFERPTAVQDPLGHVTAYTYEPAYFGVAHLTRTTWPDGATDAQTWGLNGRVATRTDPFGRITQFGYDVEGNVISVVDTLNQLTGFTYDELGRRLTHTDANSRTTHTAYDARGNIIRRTLPLGQSEHFTYDAGGNVLTHTDFNGDTTIFTYDCLGRLTGKTLPDGATVGYTYDAVDNVVSHTDAVGTTTYTYDRRDRLTAVTDPTGVTLSYTYDDAGNRLTLTGPGGTTQYAYDAANRLTAVTDPDGNTTQYTYDAAGRRTGVLHANGTATTYTYDARHRLTALEHRDAGNALLARYEYQLDAAGKRTRLTESTGRTVDYQYDALGRLVRVDDVLGPVTLTTEHTYDAVGNRVSATRQGQTQTYLYDANNRLTALLAADTFTYDANGNLLSHTRDGQTTTYSYDGQNRLVQVTEPVGNVTVNRYDDAGLRVATIVNGTTTQFVWDRAHPSGLPQIVAELDDTGNVLNRYTYGDDRISLHTGGQTYAYHYDGMGSTRLLTDAGGAIAARYQFDAWGNLMSSSGSVPNPFLYTGEQFDPNAGFYYLRARFYDPVHGRFVSADSHPGSVYDPPSLHKYLYAHADPVNHVDPTGRFTLLVITINLGIKQAIKGSHVLALASSYGYQLYSKGKITIPAALAADLYERLQTARLNETLTLDDLRLDGEPDPDPDSIVQLDRQYGRGAIASVFLTSHSLMGAGSSESFIMPFVDGVQTWIASLPIVDEKPGHYHNCAFNGWAARVVSLNLINFPFFARATTRKMAGVQVALSGLGTLMAYTVGDSVASVAPMGPPDGVCHNVSLPGAGG